jgi:serine protease Do
MTPSSRSSAWRDRRLLAAFGAVLAISFAVPPLVWAQAIEGGLSRLYRQVSPAVVKVVSHRIRPPVAERALPCRQLVASGLIVGENGLVVTTERVAHPGDSLLVIFADGRQVPADYAGMHSYLHLAVLRLGGAGPYPHLTRPRTGAPIPEWVATVAHGPWNGPRPGLPVLSLAQRASIEPMKVRCGDSLEVVWRVRAPFYPGNGGGALVSMSGEWMGLITGAVAVEGDYAGPLPGSERLSWDEGVIVPAALVVRAMDEIVAGPRSSTQGFLGVLATRRTDAAPDPPLIGVRVSGVLDGSPAERSGIIADDIVTRFNGSPVTDATQLTRLVSAARPGQIVQMELQRRGMSLVLDVRMGDRASGEASVARQRDRAAGQAALRREIENLQLRLRHLQQQLDADYPSAGESRNGWTPPPSN